jgi:hypothetical protein
MEIKKTDRSLGLVIFIYNYIKAFRISSLVIKRADSDSKTYSKYSKRTYPDGSLFSGKCKPFSF